MNKEYQEALNSLKDTKCDEINNCEICSLTSYCGHYQCIKTLQKAVDKANKYDELLSILEEYNVDLSNIREILVAGNMAQDWKEKAKKYDEKETPKKRIFVEEKRGISAHDECPICRVKVSPIRRYCDNCGQRLE